FRGFMPVVADVETGGLNAYTDALLVFAAAPTLVADARLVYPHQPSFFRLAPSGRANTGPAARQFPRLKLDPPLRVAVLESHALTEIFKHVRKAVKAAGCKRAVLVGHNAFFDLGFLNAAVERNDIKRNPFHPFSCFDTATLGGLAYGQTVLAKACAAADIEFDGREAHSARYDTEKTAELFCTIVNRWREMGGWPPV